jgi:glycosyltransferase involved in cell wall biosynthesis
VAKRVLYYNWAPYFAEPLVGGGVSIYCRNLLDHLHAAGGDYEPTFLYAGFDYSDRPGPPSVRRVDNPRHPGVPTFTMVDSPVAAPALLSFYDPDGHVRCAAVEACFAGFLAAQEPFDIVHFHNLEGLTAACLEVATGAGARVVFSLHNYWTVCPQVQLWQFDDHPCTDYLEGRGCVACLPDAVENDRILAERRAGLAPRYEPTAGAGDGSGPLSVPVVLDGPGLPQLAPRYRRRRHDIVDLVNRHVDVAVSVSERSSEVLASYGVSRDVLATIYIGTRATEFAVPPGNPAPYRPGDPFRLVYVGESRRDKGFFHLLDELRALPAAALRTLHLTVACRMNDPAELRMAEAGRGRLLSLAESLGSLAYHPGYAYDDLPALLAGQHLGVVPALWEDNLPQVALELLACRVPVLCSTRGGAREFVRHDAFVFDPATPGDLGRRLLAVRERPNLLAAFWSEAREPRTVEAHFDDLLAVYATLGAGDRPGKGRPPHR